MAVQAISHAFQIDYDGRGDVERVSRFRPRPAMRCRAQLATRAVPMLRPRGFDKLPGDYA